MGFVKSLLAWDSAAFALACLLDMVSTILLVHRGMAVEGNPWLAYCYHRGEVYFIIAKLLSFLPAIAFAAYYRDRFPEFVPLCLRVALVAYVVIYATSVFGQFR